MVIHTVNKASLDDRNKLIEILNKHTKNQKLIDEAICLMDKYGSMEYAKKTAMDIVTKSWNDISEMIPRSDAKNKLKAFVTFLVERSI